MCHNISTAHGRAWEGGHGGGGQQGHLSDGHFASMSSATTIVPVCVIKTVCRVQTWKWKGLCHSASPEKQDYLRIGTGFDSPAKVLHPVCVLHPTSVHCGVASKPAKSKPQFARLACPAGSAGHQPHKPLAGALGQQRCPPGSEATMGVDHDRASAGRAVEQTDGLKAISWFGRPHHRLQTKLHLTQAWLCPGSGS